jgi:hypothetical protein
LWPGRIATLGILKFSIKGERYTKFSRCFAGAALTSANDVIPSVGSILVQTLNGMNCRNFDLAVNAQVNKQ